MKPFWWRVAILPPALADCFFAIYAITSSTRMDGLGRMIFLWSGVILGLISVCAVGWTLVLPQRSARLQAVVSSIILAISISPSLLVGFICVFGDAGRTKRVEVRCFDPSPDADGHQLGVLDEGALVSWPLLQHSRDFVYVIPQPDREAREITVDCTSEQRVLQSKDCRPTNATEEDVREALGRLPPCTRKHPP